MYIKLALFANIFPLLHCYNKYKYDVNVTFQNIVKPKFKSKSPSPQVQTKAQKADTMITWDWTMAMDIGRLGLRLK